MATQKISELTPIPILNSNTSNVVIVATDYQSGISGKISATVLANGLYANNVLNVGNNAVVLPNTIAQFAGSSESYVQVNLLNSDNGGSADYVATANTGNDTTYFIDVGYANESFVPGSEYNSLGNSIFPLDGYVYVQGKQGDVGGNLTIGTTTTGTELKIIVGGGTTENVITKLSETAITLNRVIHFGDGTTQNTSFAAAGNYANAAFLQANTPSHVANSASLYANLAFSKANSALANTTGTFAGDLTVTGNTNIKTTLTIHNASMPANNQYLIITGTAGDAIGIPSNPGYTFHSAVDGGNRVAAEAYGASSVNYPGFIGRRARGTAASPAAVQNGDILARLGGNGYGATKFSQFSDARIEFVAVETHTDSSKGTQIQFWTTPAGSNVSTQIGTMNGNTVTFTGTVNPNKGFVYTPNVLSTLTTLNIDFGFDNLIKFNVNDNATITLSNYVHGKVVEVWITNSAAQNKTVTHGCLANNSTSKSTSFTILASSCAYLRYFSIDGDQANTYVSITA